jgi:hypothetical protein
MTQEFIDELVAMPSAELGELLRQTELERRDAEQRLALIATVAEQKSQFLTDGHASMSAYLKAQINCSGATANRIRRRGRLLDHHAEALDATSHGRVSVDNIDLLAKAVAHPRVGDRVAEFVPTLVDHAEHFPVADFSVLVDRVVANADSDGATPDDPLLSDATVAAGPDGVYVKVVGGTGLQAAEMKAIFERACEAEFERDVEERRARYGHAASEHPLPRSANQRRFAAQYAIHLAWASTPPDAQRPEPLVNILYTAGRAARSLADHGLVAGTGTDTDTGVFTSAADGLCAEHPDDLLAARCETSTGVPISEHDALRAMVRGQVRRAVVDSASVVIDLGGRRRLFTGAAREAAQLIAHRCAHPGCSIPAEFCQVDHLERHVDGGPTDQRNAGPACARHNLYKERAGLRSRRATNGRIHLIRPDGSVMLPVGARPPTWADSDPPDLSDPPHPPDLSERPRQPDPPERPVAAVDTGCADFETISWSEFLARDLTADAPDTCPVVRIDFAEVRSILDSS